MRTPTKSRGATAVTRVERRASVPPRFLWRLRTDRVPRDVHELTRLLLEQRGVAQQETEQFLAPSYEASLRDPLLLPQCGAAVARIQRALQSSEPVAIFGDYDVDGVTSAALLADALELLGADVRVDLPHREDGYGLSVAAVHRLVPPARLLLTVDNGTSAATAIAEAVGRGADVIIVDHHAVTGALPAGALVVNPALPSSRYPGPLPAAVGVAWHVVRALYAAEGRAGEERQLLDLVALGTLADGVQLLGENRALVRWGLEVVRRSRRPGLQALLAAAGVHPTDLSADTVTFRLAPRLNAAGRLRHANVALELLRTHDAGIARRLALEIDAVNDERKQLTDEILGEVKSTLRAPLPAVIFVAGPWPLGILGVLANRLAEEFQRPAVAVAVREDECVASLRASRGESLSEPGPSMVALVQEAEALLTKFGGHVGAAGFSFPFSALDEVAAFFRTHPDVPAAPRTPELVLDCALPLSLLSTDLPRALEALEPFGAGNSRPVFLLSGFSVAESRLVGAVSDHLRLLLRHPTETMVRPAVAFRWGERPRPPLGATVDVAAEVRRDTFRGVPRLDLHIQDLRSVI